MIIRRIIVHFLAAQKVYLITSASRLAPGTHPASYGMGLGEKQPGPEAGHSPVVAMKNERICISSPPILLLACKGNITAFHMTYYMQRDIFRLFRLS